MSTTPTLRTSTRSNKMTLSVVAVILVVVGLALYTATVAGGSSTRAAINEGAGPPADASDESGVASSVGPRATDDPLVVRFGSTERPDGPVDDPLVVRFGR